MRILSTFALALSFAACGGSSTKKSDAGTNDLAVAVEKDLSVAQGSTCYDVLVCAAGCTEGSCIANCRSMGTTAAQGQFDAIFACAYGHCLPSDAASFDGGAGSCASTTDGSNACQACITAQAQGPACSNELLSCEQP